MGNNQNGSLARSGAHVLQFWRRHALLQALKKSFVLLLSDVKGSIRPFLAQSSQEASVAMKSGAKRSTGDWTASFLAPFIKGGKGRCASMEITVVMITFRVGVANGVALVGKLPGLPLYS